MNTQYENGSYDFQSFDPHPTAPMFPHGWDLSEMPVTANQEAGRAETDEA